MLVRICAAGLVWGCLFSGVPDVWAAGEAAAPTATSSDLDRTLSTPGNQLGIQPGNQSDAVVPTLSGVPVYTVGIPKLDTTTRESDQRPLEGHVSETGGLLPGSSVQLKAVLPELDCVGFAGQVNAGGGQLKGRVGHTKPGFHTDGGAWTLPGDYPVMVQVFAGDSCAEAGMQPGDVIIELNGTSTYKLSHNSIINLFLCWDANMRNHYTVKRGNQVIRFITQVTWHPFGSGTYMEQLWTNTFKNMRY